MVHFQRKIKINYSGDDKYLPKNITRGKWLPVLGYEVRSTDRMIDGIKKVFQDVFFLVIGDDSSLVKVAEMNCRVMIDEKAELDVHAAMDLLRNITLMGKVISEKMAEVHIEGGGKKDA